MSLEPSPPAPPETTALVEQQVEHRPPLQPRQNISVAFLPLALMAFIVLAFVAAAWTLIAAVGG